MQLLGPPVTIDGVDYAHALQFYSRARSALGRYLSNFTPATVHYAGRTFPSIEHAYQAAKFQHAVTARNGVPLSPAEADEWVARFAVDGDLGGEPAAAAKSAGTKGAMKAAGLQLDAQAWSAQQDALMAALVRARADADELYRKVLRKAARDNVALLHFDRGGARSHWGGHFAQGTRAWRGENRLGELLRNEGSRRNAAAGRRTTASKGS
jgi:predicted NAD-dependent protein-ADP-ribosyltransferase YbiA (DUF1768 family)